MSDRLFRTIIGVAFLLSGFAGLIYEIVWSRYLTLLIGGTAVAHTIVLATFMGGLACGNALFGRLADHPGSNRLRLYALLELGVGMLCLLFPITFAWTTELYVAFATRVGATSPLNLGLKMILSAAVLFVPCTLMGGTLPVLAKYVVDSVAGFGSRLGWLYFVNTAGAVGGCLFAGFYVVERWGLEWGMVATAMVNIAIAACFYLLSRRPQRTAAPAGVGTPEAAGGEEAYSPAQARLALWGIGLAGGLSMLYELVWFRLLVLSVGGTVHAFSTMLAGFIAGIAAGSFLAGHWLRRRRSALALLGLCELGIALLTLLPFQWLERLPFAFHRIGSSIVHSPENYSVFAACSVAFAMLLMGVPAMLMGAALPLASRVCLRGLDRLGRSVGDVFSVNTIGNVVGSLLTGLLLLRLLGLEGTLLAGGCLSGLLGAALLYGWRPTGLVGIASAIRDSVRVAPPPSGPCLWPAALAVVGLLGAWRLYSFPCWNPLMLQAGFYRWEVPVDADAMRSYSTAAAQAARTRRVLLARDGLDASYLVEEERPAQSASTDSFNRLVRVNGKPDASTAADMATQLFLAHLGLLLHPEPHTALIVGLGSGATAGAALRHQGLRRVEVAEISPPMVEAARYFGAANDNVLSNPRLSLSIVDGRELLLLSHDRYDVIVSEPTNVWVPGIASLFTEDFYRLVRSRLRPGGLFTQWLHLYSLDRHLLAATVASLSRVFGCISLWSIGDADLVFLASAEPPAFDAGLFARRFAAVDPLRGMKSGSPTLALLSDPVLFLSNQLATDEMRRLLARRMPAAPYHDLFPRMEFEAARAQFVGHHDPLLTEFDGRKWPVGTERLCLERYLDRFPLTAEESGRLQGLYAAMGGPYLRLARSLALTAAAESGPLLDLPDDLAGLVLLVRELGRQIDAGRPSVAVCGRYLAAEGQLLLEAVSVFGRRSPASLEGRLEACATAHPDEAPAYRRQAVAALAWGGADEDARRQFRKAVAEGVLGRLSLGERAAFLVEGAKVSLRTGQREEARQLLLAALSADASQQEAAQLLAVVGSLEPAREQGRP